MPYKNAEAGVDAGLKNILAVRQACFYKDEVSKAYSIATMPIRIQWGYGCYASQLCASPGQIPLVLWVTSRVRCINKSTNASTGNANLNHLEFEPILKRDRERLYEILTELSNPAHGKLRL